MPPMGSVKYEHIFIPTKAWHWPVIAVAATVQFITSSRPRSSHWHPPPPPTFILSPILWECFFPCLGWFLCLVIRYVLVTYIWRHSWHSNWLGIGPVSLSDGKCLISAETGGTRISDTCPSLKNLANVSVWSSIFYYSNAEPAPLCPAGSRVCKCL